MGNGESVRAEMSAPPTKEDVAELRRRVMDESGLGRPEPLVSTDVASLLADLIAALEDTFDALEVFRAHTGDYL